jgi:hypothetical protein
LEILETFPTEEEIRGEKIKEQEVGEERGEDVYQELLIDDEVTHISGFPQSVCVHLSYIICILITNQSILQLL